MEKKKEEAFFLGGWVLIKVSFPEGSNTVAVQSGRDAQPAGSVNLLSLKKSYKSEKIRILNKTKKKRNIFMDSIKAVMILAGQLASANRNAAFRIKRLCKVKEGSGSLFPFNFPSVVLLFIR